MRSATNFAALSALALLAVTVTPVEAREPAVAAPSGVGPEADYPVVVGDPFTVDGKTYVPRDTMNYDAVGHSELGEGGDRVLGAHRTLPLPSYVEVTSLTSGKTILVRITQRGPMAGPNLLALSPGAWAQLGLAPGANAPVRVRRVNPPEAERAVLRTGQRAPERMETPPGLLGVLKRRLGESSVAVLSESARGPGTNAMAVPAAAVTPEAIPPAQPAPDKAKVAIKAPSAPKPLASVPTKHAVVAAKTTPVPSTVPGAVVPAASKAGHFIQAAAFSSEARAKAAAAKLGGAVSHIGALWRVRLGPFVDKASADRALAKARSAGFGDSRIVRER